MTFVKGDYRLANPSIEGEARVEGAKCPGIESEARINAVEGLLRELVKPFPENVSC